MRRIKLKFKILFLFLMAMRVINAQTPFYPFNSTMLADGVPVSSTVGYKQTTFFQFFSPLPFPRISIGVLPLSGTPDVYVTCGKFWVPAPGDNTPWEEKGITGSSFIEIPANYTQIWLGDSCNMAKGDTNCSVNIGVYGSRPSSFTVYLTTSAASAVLSPDIPVLGRVPSAQLDYYSFPVTSAIPNAAVTLRLSPSSNNGNLMMYVSSDKQGNQRPTPSDPNSPLTVLGTYATPSTPNYGVSGPFSITIPNMVANGNPGTHGLISLTGDGTGITVSGFDAPVGAFYALTPQTNVPLYRPTIGVLSGGGSWDISTRVSVNTFNTGIIQSAVCTNRLYCYMCGQDAVEGVIYIPYGSDGGEVHISTSSQWNTDRYWTQLNIYNGVLTSAYVASSAQFFSFETSGTLTELPTVPGTIVEQLIYNLNTNYSSGTYPKMYRGYSFCNPNLVVMADQQAGLYVWRRGRTDNAPPATGPWNQDIIPQLNMGYFGWGYFGYILNNTAAFPGNQYNNPTTSYSNERNAFIGAACRQVGSDYIAYVTSFGGNIYAFSTNNRVFLNNGAPIYTVPSGSSLRGITLAPNVPPAPSPRATVTPSASGTPKTAQQIAADAAAATKASDTAQTNAIIGGLVGGLGGVIIILVILILYFGRKASILDKNKTQGEAQVHDEENYEVYESKSAKSSFTPKSVNPLDHARAMMEGKR
jgi:hypothetical protein